MAYVSVWTHIKMSDARNDGRKYHFTASGFKDEAEAKEYVSWYEDYNMGYSPMAYVKQVDENYVVCASRYLSCD